ncbi:MAG: hypothetical protein ACR2HG_00805 [Pyrinomonadaceae bacterium]
MISQTNQRIFCHRGLLIALLACVCLVGACGKKTVATADNEFEASRMFDVLYSNHFQVEKKKSEGEAKTWDIVVDEGWFGEGEAATAIQVLRDYGLPRPPEPEIKTEDALGMTSERAEKERQKRELQRQIESLLYKLPNVISVGVIVAEPTNNVWDLPDEKAPTTATVIIVLNESETKLTPEAIQNQVARAVPNLKPENIFVSITQQSLREIPLEKLAEKRRSNAVFGVGIGVIILLALALAAVWITAKRRRKKISDAEFDDLLEAKDDEELEDIERPLLNGEDEE